LQDQVASLNPPLVSGAAKYFKAVGKIDATNPGSGTNSCLVDGGIRTDQPATDGMSGTNVKDNPFDNQANGNASLTVAKVVTSAAGVESCSSQDTNWTTVNVYPKAYTPNGKEVIKYNELDAKLHPLQTQVFLRFGATDPANPTLVTLTGLAIKGVGIGGDLNQSFTFGPEPGDTKSIDFLDCVAATGNTVGDTQLKKLHIAPTGNMSLTLP
jgi:hypothetical protein